MQLTEKPVFKAIFFDLDGTLMDTAGDLGAALNRLCTELKQPIQPSEKIRTVASDGTLGLLRLGFGIGLQDPNYPLLKNKLLDYYQENIATNTQLFPGMERVLARLAEKKCPWGIVTNKPKYLTDQLLAKFTWDYIPSVVISGDSLAVRKPHPLPLIHACKAVQQDPSDCIYVGDAIRDILAGNAARMYTIAAAYGYINDDEDIQTWHAKQIIQNCKELLDIL